MTKFIFIAPILVLLFSGCEKVIDVDLNETNPVIVIEGILTSNPDSAYVRISRTTSYFDNNPQEVVGGAIVKITDNKGHEFELHENAGMYVSNSVLTYFDTEYTLTVDVEGTVYKSSSTIHRTVYIDSLSVVANDSYSVFMDGYNVNMYFHDPQEENNYYRLKTFVNGEPEDAPEDFIFFDDNNTNGKFVEVRIRRKVYEAGDTVTYELQTLDKAAYEYFDAISEIIDDNSEGTASPANPNPNFSSGALGYFSAQTSNKKTIIIGSKNKSLE